MVRLIFAVVALLTGSRVVAGPLKAEETFSGQKIIMTLEGIDHEQHVVDPLPLNKLFAIQINIRDQDGHLTDIEVTKFDAQMPTHRHGMVTKPRITKKSTGTYLVEGVKLHMAGPWQFTVDLARNAEKREVRVPLLMD